jgi:PAS domain S-box-containing protein
MKKNWVRFSFLEVNPTFEIQTGLQRDDLIGKTVLVAMPELKGIGLRHMEKLLCQVNPFILKIIRMN